MPPPAGPLSPPAIAVIGSGAFGSNHLRIYRELGSLPEATLHLAAVVESDPARAEVLRQQVLRQEVPSGSSRARLGPSRIFASLDQLLAAHSAGEVTIDAASVCVPTQAHAPVAAALLTAGIDVLLEKPMSATLQEADTLIALAARHGRILQVGHLERFNPAVLAVHPLIHLPMFFESHRLSIFTPRSLDVDVVFDLMIHDLDIVLSLAESPVRSVQAVGLPVLSGKVDIANVRVEFDSGCVANFTASRVSTERVRKLRFFQPHQYVSIDYARQDLLCIDVQPQPGTPQPAGNLSMAKPPVTPGEPLRLEIEAFVECVRTRRQPQVTGEAGRAALALALQINTAIADHAHRARLDRFI